MSINSFANTQTESEIVKRIAPVGNIYLDGDIKITNAASVSTKSAAPRTGKQIFNTYCMACHTTGVLGAPKRGDANAWKPRLAKGMSILYKNAMAGFNSMPPKGTCADCSNEEMRSSVEFMIK
ncbi:MAG: cytochrome c5 family protein [Psychromonas sp.]|nr:cytochrome c5 family protein [Psychromonas sp.]